MRTPLALLFLLLETILGGCNSRQVWLVVTVEGLTPEVASLGATIRLNGQLTKEGDLKITSNLQKFGVLLSTASEKNNLHITVAGVDSDNSTILGDEQEADISSASINELTVKLHSTQICNFEGWCWQNPPPQGNRLNNFSALDAKTVWAVGYGSTVLRWNGWYWRRIEVPLKNFSHLTMLGVWARNFAEAWIVGENGTIAKCNGQYCKQIFEAGKMITNTAGALVSVWGSDSEGVWAVGGAYVLRCSDAGCITISGTPLKNFYAVWSGEPDNAWVAGDEGTLLRCSSTACTQHPSSTKSNLSKIWGVDPNNIWILGIDTIVKCSNDSCSVLSGNTTGDLLSIWAKDMNAAWVVGSGSGLIQCINNSCTTIATVAPANLLSVWGSDAEHVWAVGGNGLILKCNDSACSILPSKTVQPWVFTWGDNFNNLEAITLFGKIATCNDSSCAVQPAELRDVAPFYSFKTIWGSGADNVWIAGDGGSIVKCIGNSCTAIPSSTSSEIVAAWGADISNIWLVGSDGAVIKCKNTACALIPSGTSNRLVSILGINSDNIWAAGEKGTIIKCNNTACSTISSGTTNTLLSMWGPTGVDNIWIVGYGGTLINCALNTCTVKTSGTSQNLSSVWGPRYGNEFWAAGWNGTVLKCNTGTNPPCSVIPSGVTFGLNSIWGNFWRIFAAGSNGSMLICERDGSGCTPYPTYGLTDPLITVRGNDAEATELWITGYRGSFLESCGPPGPAGCISRSVGTDSILESVWGTDDAKNTWLIGNEGAILHRYKP